MRRAQNISAAESQVSLPVKWASRCVRTRKRGPRPEGSVPASRQPSSQVTEMRLNLDVREGRPVLFLHLSFPPSGRHTGGLRRCKIFVQDSNAFLPIRSPCSPDSPPPHTNPLTSEPANQRNLSCFLRFGDEARWARPSLRSPKPPVLPVVSPQQLVMTVVKYTAKLRKLHSEHS